MKTMSTSWFSQEATESHFARVARQHYRAGEAFGDAFVQGRRRDHDDTLTQ